MSHTARLDSDHLFLRCPTCAAALAVGSYDCAACGITYEVRSGVPLLLRAEDVILASKGVESDRENTFKNFFKRWPRVYSLMVRIVAPVLVTGLTARKFVRRFGSESLLLNVGSGPTRIHPSIVNIDLYPFPNVDFIASVHRLPFVDGSFDVVMSEDVLEHVPNPECAVREIARVTKPGGLIYLGVPFIYPLHPSPRDFTRWSADGLRDLCRDCKVVEAGVLIGPTSGMLVVLAMWIAIICSFGIAPLRKVINYIAMVVLSPLCFLDLVYAHLPGAEAGAGGFYIVVRK